jgi:hypothetical protein
MEFNSHHFAAVQRADPVSGYATCRKLLKGSEANILVRVVYKMATDVFSMCLVGEKF